MGKTNTSICVTLFLLVESFDAEQIVSMFDQVVWYVWISDSILGGKQIFINFDMFQVKTRTKEKMESEFEHTRSLEGRHK